MDHNEFNPHVEEIINRLKAVVEQLQQTKQQSTWYKKIAPPRELIQEFYSLDRQLSQLLEMSSMSPEQRQTGENYFKAAYQSLYEQFPERG